MSTMTITKSKARAYEALKAYIADRASDPEDRLPTLQQMARRFEVGVTAIRQAVLRLEAEGLLVARQGSGIYATGRSIRRLRVGLFGLTEGHLWEDLARKLVAALGADPDIILTMIPLYSDESYEDELTRLQHRLRTDGLDVMIAVAVGHFQQHARVLQHIGHEIRLIEVYDSHHLRQLPSPNSEQDKTGRVLSDIVTGHQMAMQHLLDTGCKNTLLLSHGGATHLEEACLELAGDRHVHIRHGSPTKPDYARHILNYLKAHPKIDSIFGFGDWRIASILQGLRQAGYRVPKDIKLIGYGDTQWTSFVEVPLSSVNIQPDELTRTTRQMVLTGKLTQQHLIKPRIVIRQSTVIKAR